MLFSKCAINEYLPYSRTKSGGHDIKFLETSDTDLNKTSDMDSNTESDKVAHSDMGSDSDKLGFWTPDKDIVKILDRRVR